MDDRRRYERRPLAAPIEVLDAESGQLVGLLADISSGGMMLRTDRPLPPGQKLLLTMAVASDGDGPPTVIEATVRWCEPDLDPATHVAGLRFEGHTPPAGVLVEDLRRRLQQV
jgi:c-di-GMP-binding flagellar brake protein YcgR